MNSPTRFRIATWNLERPKQNGWTKNQRRLNKIYEIDADVWVLTETSKAIALEGDYEPTESCAHDNGENLSTIWSRWKVCGAPRVTFLLPTTPKAPCCTTPSCPLPAT